jgi:hypothetical protein
MLAGHSLPNLSQSCANEGPRSPGLCRLRSPLARGARDLRHLPLSQRKKRLVRLLPVTVGPLNRVPSLEEHGRELFEAACRLDLEGIVAKRKADPYGPRTQWYKIKNPTYTQAREEGSFLSEAGRCDEQAESPGAKTAEAHR